MAEGNPRLSTWVVAGGVLAIVVVTVLYAVVVWKSLVVATDRGTFGDMFGGLNTLFSGLAFLGVVLAIHLQMRELRAQQHEIKQAREAHQASAQALKDQLASSERAARIQGLNLLLVANRARLASIESPTNVREMRDQRRLVAAVRALEGQLSDMVTNEPRSDSNEHRPE